MSKFQEVLNTYEQEFKRLGMSYDQKLLIQVAKGCGPSIYRADASRVSVSDKRELERIKKNFLIKKLGLKDSTKLDEGIAEVVEAFGRNNRYKYRAMFYYMLTKKFKKSGVYRVKNISHHIAENKNRDTPHLELAKYLDKIKNEDDGLLKRLAK